MPCLVVVVVVLCVNTMLCFLLACFGQYYYYCAYGIIHKVVKSKVSPWIKVLMMVMLLSMAGVTLLVSSCDEIMCPKSNGGQGGGGQ